LTLKEKSGQKRRKEGQEVGGEGYGRRRERGVERWEGKDGMRVEAKRGCAGKEKRKIEVTAEESSRPRPIFSKFKNFISVHVRSMKTTSYVPTINLQQ
jgi:hypothetical protein